MRLITHLWLCLLVAGVCAACTGDDIETPATDGDGDADTIVDGDRDDEREIDREDDTTLGSGFACEPQTCRKGFLPPPSCLMPDSTLIPPPNTPAVCESADDCAPTETCVAASPDWLCVPESLPRWLSGYRFGSTCAWELIAESQSSCAITGVWENAGDLVSLEYCSETETSRLCRSGDCRNLEESLPAKTLMDVVACGIPRHTFVLLRDESEWPYTYLLYRDSEDGLERLKHITNLTDQYLIDGASAHFLCGSAGRLFAITPGEVLHYRDGAFQSFVTLDELRNQLESQELWGAFDGAAFDPDHPERLRLGAAGDYQTWRFILDADGSLIDARRNEIDSWQTRILPLFGSDWLIGEGKNLKRYITGESYLDLFTLAENETLIGVDGQGGLLTRTLSRLFRYPLSADALPVAADSGLPFPADYPGYLPAIRQVFLHAELGDSPAFLWMQFRPVSDF